MVARASAMDLEIVSAMMTPGSGGPTFSQITLSKSNLLGPRGIWGQRRGRMPQSWMAEVCGGDLRLATGRKAHLATVLLFLEYNCVGQWNYLLAAES